VRETIAPPSHVTLCSVCAQLQTSDEELAVVRKDVTIAYDFDQKLIQLNSHIFVKKARNNNN